MASASARAQSTWPSATNSSRWANWRSSLGWMVKPSGTVRTSAARAPSTSGADPGLLGLDVRLVAARLGADRSGASDGSPRTSSSTAWSLRVEVVESGLGVVERDVAAAHQRLGVELAHRALGVDALVHQRLGVARVVALVVPVLAVADQVDHDVLVEGLPEARRPAGPPARTPRGRHRSRGRSGPGPSWPRRSGRPTCGPRPARW